MARPQFKNSKIRIMSSMSDSEQIGASFWFNIDDQELQTQLEKYYALSGKNPSMQFQRKLGEGNYQTTASANLFLPRSVKTASKIMSPLLSKKAMLCSYNINSSFTL